MIGNHKFICCTRQPTDLTKEIFMKNYRVQLNIALTRRTFNINWIEKVNFPCIFQIVWSSNATVFTVIFFCDVLQNKFDVDFQLSAGTTLWSIKRMQMNTVSMQFKVYLWTTKCLALCEKKWIPIKMLIDFDRQNCAKWDFACPCSFHFIWLN